jgi:hypothetical protein
MLRTFSAEFEDAREIALSKPLSARAPWQARGEVLAADFLILREDQIVSITGTYIAPSSSEADGN